MDDGERAGVESCWGQAGFAGELLLALPEEEPPDPEVLDEVLADDESFDVDEPAAESELAEDEESLLAESLLPEDELAFLPDSRLSVR
ncbi:MAG: hypothetical protein JWQ53_2756 [Klenkia sp.]|nr:hypothetical protein [Klenkia sp.]